jgi:hypothetical protein
MISRKSGKEWVDWANLNAKNSTSLIDLDPMFKSNVNEFIKALTDAGAVVKVGATRRNNKRAYLFHWSWKISLSKVKPSVAGTMSGVDIIWDHGDLTKSINGAEEMVNGFGLAIPPSSTVAPSLTSNHIAGKAIDMDIVWSKKIKVKKKDASEVEISFMPNPNNNNSLIVVGASYGVFKLKTDRPHWSYNGK